MFEVEQKFHVDDVEVLRRRLSELGAIAEPEQQHSDTYYSHPSRDFAQTREALRVRRVDGIPLITYKGSKLPGAIKARREMEWRLDPGDPDGGKMEELLVALGFGRVSEVRKRRLPFRLPGGGEDDCIVIDQVERLGTFAEIERIADDSDGIEPARAGIADLAGRLGLTRDEPRSYLRMVLELDAD